ncbi:hypothetical protein ABZ705_16320 [Streptomyces sp. NPDC006984]|uniref:hypothetical protein n=1 Tax=Streptomyces sp. NPDC006984 TaxID=3155463 RepID=UPI0034109962
MLAREELNADAGLGARVELEQFDMVARAFHATPRRERQRGIRRRDPLGFGLEGIVAAVTALVLAVATDSLSQLAKDRADRSVTGFASWIRRVVLRRPGPPGEPGTAPEPEENTVPLTAVQMQRIHRIARLHAHRMSIPEQTAEAIANGIIAELAMTRTANGTSASGSPADDPERGEPRP